MEIDLLQRLEERAVAMEREGHVTVARYLRLAAGDIADLRKALTALYEACERRANEEGGDFGAAIGPAAELAEAALSASPSPRRQLTQEDVEMFDAALYASTTVVHEGELVNIIPDTTVKGETL